MVVRAEYCIDVTIIASLDRYEVLEIWASVESNVFAGVVRKALAKRGRQEGESHPPCGAA